MGTCKYTKTCFKAPKTTHWIGCDYPGCDKWFYESCLNLKFSTDLEREMYAFVCKSHGRIKDLDQFKDQVMAVVSDQSMTEEEEQNEGPSHAKRQRRSYYNDKTAQIEQSVPQIMWNTRGTSTIFQNFFLCSRGNFITPLRPEWLGGCLSPETIFMRESKDW